jgi:KTSC domain
MIRLFIVAIFVPFSSNAIAESVVVKYRGEVDLAPFQCTTVNRSSFVNRVCYDEGNQYMLIQLGPTYYHYCGIDHATVSALLNAESVGRFYNASIKGRFDCRVTPPPKY